MNDESFFFLCKQRWIVDRVLELQSGRNRRKLHLSTVEFFTVFIRVYGKGLWKCDLAYNKAGVLPNL